MDIGGANDHDRGIKTGRKGNDDQCDHELYAIKIQADRHSSLRALVNAPTEDSDCSGMWQWKGHRKGQSDM